MAKTRTRKKKEAAKAPPADQKVADGVASEQENAKLVHTDDLRDQAAAGTPGYVPTPEQEEGHSITTRDEKTDLGVTMLPGSPAEPVGPEDALGPGPTRGDYRDRLGGDGYNPHEGETPQRPRAEEIGDVEGLKGGVDTASK